jgi:hypothetical protein
LPLDYYIITGHDVDPETGEKVTVESVTKVRKAIVLRAREFTSFVYDLAYISANKDFTQGGFFDPEDRRIILEAKEIPNIEPKVRDYVVFQNERYTIKDIFHLENDYGWIILVRKLRGAPVTFAQNLLSVMDLTDNVTNETVDQLTRSVESVLTLTHSSTSYFEVP